MITLNTIFSRDIHIYKYESYVDVFEKPYNEQWEAISEMEVVACDVSVSDGFL